MNIHVYFNKYVISGRNILIIIPYLTNIPLFILNYLNHLKLLSVI
jgi:hypothetical protein